MENREAAKYEEVWKHAAYRQVAPGEHHVERFIELARPRSGHVCCDFGCGTGRAALKIASLTDLSVTGVDFAGNSLDAGVRSRLGERFRFLQHDLTAPIGETFDYGFCTDVLEHIQPKDVDRVLTNIFTSARKVYLAVSTVDDVMGALVGEPLHLTVESPFWWHDKLTSLGIRVDWSHYEDGLACFYGSAYANAQDFDDISKLNVGHEVVIANIKANLGLGLKEVVPHEVQDTVVYLLAGGPSLKQHESEVVEAGKSGVPCVTVNGTYGWLLERGIKPAAHVMVDAREFNRRFITRHVDTCKYLVSSQVDHELVKSLPAEQTWLWHSGQSDLVKQTLMEWSEESGVKREWFPVFGASTVVSRAITLLAMLGFRKIEIFGWDSCLLNNEHHSYAQPENDSDCVVPITVGSREFRCHPWMVVQANEFPKLVRHIYSQVPDLQLSVRGDGLIAAILEHSAEMNNGC